VDDLWKKKVDQDILLLKQGQVLSRSAIAENTELTREGLGRLEKKIEDQIEETRPVTEAMHKMEAGINFIATVGRWGGKLVKGGLYLAGGWFFVKAILGGAGVEAAAAAFWKIVAGGK
jgi:hypothetical protein